MEEKKDYTEDSEVAVLCFYCLNHRGDKARAGDLEGNALLRFQDDEAAFEAIADMVPCEECKVNLSRGIMLIRAPQGVQGVYVDEIPNIERTHTAVVGEESLRVVMEAMECPELVIECAFANRFLIVEASVFDQIIDPEMFKSDDLPKNCWVDASGEVN